MSKILLGAGVAVIAAAAFAAPSAYARGGGWTPPWASAWYSPDAHSLTTEGRSVSVGEPAQSRGDVVHKRRDHRTHRHATPEQ
jgi:hypothetical protein